MKGSTAALLVAIGVVGAMAWQTSDPLLVLPGFFGLILGGWYREEQLREAGRLK